MYSGNVLIRPDRDEIIVQVDTYLVQIDGVTLYTIVMGLRI